MQYLIHMFVVFFGAIFFAAVACGALQQVAPSWRQFHFTNSCSTYVSRSVLSLSHWVSRSLDLSRVKIFSRMLVIIIIAGCACDNSGNALITLCVRACVLACVRACVWESLCVAELVLHKAHGNLLSLIWCFFCPAGIWRRFGYLSALFLLLFAAGRVGIKCSNWKYNYAIIMLNLLKLRI